MHIAQDARADFIVIDQNILKIPAEKIHKTRVLQTVLRGKTVFSGWNIVDADTGESQEDEVEYDFTLDFKPKQGLFKGLWVRLRYVYIDFDSGVGHRWNTRVIINYKVPGPG